MKKKLFNWIFRDQIQKFNDVITSAEHQLRALEEKQHKVDVLLGSIDVSVDVNQHSDSWAVISIQGENDYIKFINLGHSDIREISHFLRKFDRRHRIKVDAPIGMSKFLKIDSYR